MALNKASLALIVTINAAMNTEVGYALATEKEAGQLVKEQLAEFNPEIRDGDKIAIRLTDAGLAQVPASTESNETVTEIATATSAVASSIAVFAGGFTPSRKTRSGRTGASYPFGDLEVGGFFFIPATEAKPEPAKSIASTVNSAIKGYANPVLDEAGQPVQETYKVKGETKTRAKLEPTRKFAVESVEAGKVYGEWTAPANGAVVYRSA